MIKFSQYLYICICVFFIQTVQAQLLVNTELPHSPAVILDFNQDPNNAMGLVLPIVNEITQNMVNGTMLFDKSDRRVKYKKKGKWVSLSYVDGILDNHIENPSVDIESSTYVGEDINLAVKGVLVLESENKAMVLPHVKDPLINVKNPYPGMICYDPTTKAMFLYDGRYWNIWRKSSDLN